MKKLILVIVLAMVLAGFVRMLWADAGVSGAQVLLQQSSARIGAMAGAFSALSGDVAAIGVNPAGAYDLEKMEISLQHVAGFEGLSTEYAIGGLPLPDLGVAGFQILYRTMPAINNQVADEPVISAKDMIYGIFLARSLLTDLQFGINLKMVAMELGPVDASTIAADLGFRYQADSSLTFGAALRNLGMPVQFNAEADPLPLTMIAGASYVFVDAPAQRLLADLDLDYLVPDQNLAVRLGVEYGFRRSMALRLGYVYSQQKSVRGLSGGVGFNIRASERVQLLLDYTLQPQSWEDGDFEIENLITLSAKF